MGYEQMGNRTPLCFVVATVPGQSNQWRKDHRKRSVANQQPSNHRFKDSGQQSTSKQYLSGSAVPPIKNQAGCSHRDQGHGRQAGPLGLPHTALWHEIRRSRSRVLRGTTPADPDYAPQMEGRQARIQSDRSSRSLEASFWGVFHSLRGFFLFPFSQAASVATLPSALVVE